MSDVLHICREHGQPPSWWDGLDRGEQVLLLAELGRRVEQGRL